VTEGPDGQDGGALPGAEAEQPMHVHRPKPLHGVRDILTEIAVIVVGIVIALGGEQIVEQMHWAHAVREARASLAGEMADANAYFAFRVAASPCIKRRLDTIEGLIEQAAAHKPVPTVGPIGGDIGHGLSDSEWQAQRASQTLTHFDERELSVMGSYYHELDSLAPLVFKENEAWDELRVLQGDPLRLGPEDFAGLRRALQHAKYDNFLFTLISGQELGMAREVHVKTPAASQSHLNQVCGPQLGTIDLGPSS
jgi:hypothetical protein